MTRDPLTKGFWIDLFHYLSGEGHEVTDSPMARYKRYTNALEIIHGLISQLLLRCDYHGSGQSNEQMAVTLAGGSCLASVAKLPRTLVHSVVEGLMGMLTLFPRARVCC